MAHVDAGKTTVTEEWIMEQPLQIPWKLSKKEE